ncbi:MAG: hypothetical protein ACRYFK_17200 [Janthinobacterium lividum]
MEAVAQGEDPRCFKVVDETGLHLAFARCYGRTPDVGQRVGQGVPRRVGTPVSLAGALPVNGLEAVLSRDGALAWITCQDAQNWVDHCGYHVHSL